MDFDAGSDSQVSEPPQFYTWFKKQQQHTLADAPLPWSADYVIRFRFQPPTAKDKRPAEERDAYQTRVLTAYRALVARLTSAGLSYEVRRVDHRRLLIFVLCPHTRLQQEFNRAQVQDWISGVSYAAPNEEQPQGEAEPATSSLKAHTALDNGSADRMSTATRIRLVHRIITESRSEGGAGIRTDANEFVEAIYPLHDGSFNKILLKKWTTKWFITQQDLLEIRNHFGEKIAYYFEFLQFYFIWLAIPSAVGVLAWLLDAGFAPIYALFNVGWSLLFMEMWRRREQELATWWSVRHCSKLERRRHAFRPERMLVDSVTGATVPYYPSWKRWARRLITVPILATIGAVFFLVVGLIFACELVVYEYYQGPFMGIVHYIPLIAYSVAIWYFGDAYTGIARWLNDFENYETDAQHNRHYTYKLFVINFAVGYMFILYTAWVYIPFNAEIAQLLAQITGWSIQVQSAGLDKLQERVIYYVLTAQVINLFTEVGMPWLMRGASTGARKVTNKVAEKRGKLANTDTTDIDEESDVNVRKFLKRVAEEDELPEYDTYEDYAEMVTQFGHVVLFSGAWAMSPLLSFVNNFVELRSDAYKICIHTRRQVPARVESIGPWIDALLLLSWLSAVVNAMLVHQFGSTQDYQLNSLYRLLFVTLIAEHAYFVARWLLRAVLADMPSWAVTLSRKKEHELKRRWLQEMKVETPTVESPLPTDDRIDKPKQDDTFSDHGVQEIVDAFKLA